MEELLEIPDEFLEPILPCLDLLKNVNIQIYEKPKTFCKINWRSLLVVPSVIAYHASLTMYMSKVFRGELQLDELAYVVSVYVICTQCKIFLNIYFSKSNEPLYIVFTIYFHWYWFSFVLRSPNLTINDLLYPCELC